MEFVQVRVRTNMSDPFPKKIVRERLTEFSLLNSVIRLLRGEIAEFRVLVVAGYRVSAAILVRMVGGLRMRVVCSPYPRLSN